MAQERATRTRRALVHAAAEEFDRRGYHGASLAAISQTVGMSLGALTFHFPTKDRLVEAIHALGLSMTQREMARVDEIPGCPMRRVRATLVAVTRLLQDEVVVRGAARLGVERPCPGYAWTATWVPKTGERLEQAHSAGCLRPEPAPEDVTALAVGLVAALASGLHSWAGAPNGAAQVILGWDLVVSALRSDGPADEPLRADELSCGPGCGRRSRGSAE
ncbi:TetR/AcrR family transcriptional regulator [Streptomyces bluensis]|uniref:TetR/AcrR family transcriptional regulator n=1 Tax=Streptomyces bluensis TaxID=33897 RepID=UPI003326101B